MKLRILLIIILLPILCIGQQVKNYKQTTTGVNVVLIDGSLNILPLADNAVRIKFYKDEKIKLP